MKRFQVTGAIVAGLLFCAIQSATAAPSDILKQIRKNSDEVTVVNPGRVDGASPRSRADPSDHANRPTQQFPNDRNRFRSDQDPGAYGSRYYVPTSHTHPGNLRDRNWSPQEIDRVITQPHTVRRAEHKFNNDSPALAYYRQDGHYVVVDRFDQRLVAVSDKTKTIDNYRDSKTFASERARIIDPYVPNSRP